MNMLRLKTYTSVAIALLLLAGPWLHSSEISAAPKDEFCGCCQGPCQGCCCSVPESAETEESDNTCSCNISDSATIPELPLEFHEYRVKTQTETAQHIDYLSDELTASLDSGLPTSGNSPPSIPSRPAYVLFSAFLI